MSESDKGKTEEQVIIETAMKRLKRAVDADEHNRRDAVDDLKFLNLEQWDSGEKARRAAAGRPALQVPILQTFVQQLVGDMRHNRPQIKITPVDDKADLTIAKIREGLVRNIEYQSNAGSIYDFAGQGIAECGYGAWRVLTRYTDENPFAQEVYLERITNPLMVYMDPDAKDFMYADAEFGFILEKIPRWRFEELYPDATLPGGDALKQPAGIGSEHWWDGDTITVAEYFTRDTKKVTLCMMDDGMVIDKDDADELIRAWEDEQKRRIDKASLALELGKEQGGVGQPPSVGTPALSGGTPLTTQMMPGNNPAPPPPAPQQLPQGQAQQPVPPSAIPGVSSVAPDMDGTRPRIIKSRTTTVPVIKHYVLTALDILSKKTTREDKKFAREKEQLESDFPGKYIPIVLVRGRERNIEGKTHIRSLIRDAKDSQKMLNYWTTAAAEMVSLTPKTPWIATPKQIEGHEQRYASANVENHSVLLYNPDPEAPGPPQRLPVPQPPTALFQQIAVAEQNIKTVIGMFGADIGEAGPERTGAAVLNKQKPGDIGTYVFVDNLQKAVAHCGRIINEMISDVYDSERDIRIRNVDESQVFSPVNSTAGNVLRAIQSDPIRYAGIKPADIKKVISKYGTDVRFNDITVGKYDVVVTTGPSYATQRQESVATLLQMMMAMPQQMALASDIIVRNMDFKDSEELSDRLRKTLPFGMAKPKEGEMPQQPPPPPPQVQIQQAKLQSEQMKVQMQQMKLEIEKLKLQSEQMALQAESQPDHKAMTSQANLETKARIEGERFAREEVRQEEKYRRERELVEIKHRMDMQEKLLDRMLKTQGG